MPNLKPHLSHSRRDIPPLNPADHRNSAPPSTESAPQRGTDSTNSRLVIASGRSVDVVEFEVAVVDFFVHAAGILGVPKSVAAIYGIVFSSPAPVSFADIESRLDISRGSISQGLRVLREVGALKEVSAPSDKAELFSPDLHMRRLAVRFLETRVQEQLDVGGVRLTALTRAIPRGRLGDATEIRKRIQSLREWHSKARALLPLARTFLKIT